VTIVSATRRHPTDLALLRLVLADPPDRASRVEIEDHIDRCAPCLDRFQDVGAKVVRAEAAAIASLRARARKRPSPAAPLAGPLTAIDVGAILTKLGTILLVSRRRSALPMVPASDLGSKSDWIDLLRKAVEHRVLRGPLADRIADTVHAVARREGVSVAMSDPLPARVLELAVSVAPRHGGAWITRGSECLGRRDFDEARACFREARSLHLRDAAKQHLAVEEGMLAFLSPDYRVAARWFESASKGPVLALSEIARFDLMVAWWKKGRLADARTALGSIRPTSETTPRLVRNALMVDSSMNRFFTSTIVGRNLLSSMWRIGV
jgi:hypothetical protein